jgi:hypothetical protein
MALQTLSGGSWMATSELCWRRTYHGVCKQRMNVEADQTRTLEER